MPILKQADANHEKVQTKQIQANPETLKQADTNHKKLHTKQLTANHETSWRQSQEITN